MRIVFFGNTEFSRYIVDYLFNQGFNIVGIVTNPDKAKKRSSKVQPSYVKQWVSENHPNVPIFQNETLNNDDFKRQMEALCPDVFVVVAYGKILPVSVLNIPKIDCINVHASILPKYRGASPIEAALINGDDETGVSLMRMVKAMDAGPVFLVKKVKITPEMTKIQLIDLLQKVGCEALKEVIDKLAVGKISPKNQDESRATYVKKILTSDTQIDWEASAESIFNKIRAYSPRPGAWMEVDFSGTIKRVKVLASRVVDIEEHPCKMSVVFSKDEWIVAAKGGGVSLLELQIQGKKELDIQSFLRGCQKKPIII